MSSPWKDPILLLFGVICFSIQQINGSYYWTFKENISNGKDTEDIIRKIGYEELLPSRLLSDKSNIYLSPHLNPAQNFTFGNILEINLRILNETDQIVLHYGKLAIKSIITTDNHSKLNIIHQKYDEKTQKYTIVFDAALKVKSIVTIKIIYNRQISDSMTGFNKKLYPDTKGSIKWFAATQLKNSRARDIFPCFDEFRQTAMITINILRRKSEKSATDMASSITGTIPDEEQIWDVYDSREPILPCNISIFMADSPSSTGAKNKLLNERILDNSSDTIKNTSSDLLTSMNDVLDKFIDDTDVDKKYRLPITVIPSHYTINLHPHIIVNNFTFDGTVAIITNAIVDSSTIVLHIDEIECHEVNLIVNTKIVSNTISIDEKYHFLTITTGQLIKNGSDITITIKYTGKLNEAMRGFYRSSYTDAAHKKKWLAATHLEPIGARSMFPCFDEPALKATFKISVVRPADYKAISNTKLQGTVKQGDYYVDTFETTPIMSTYLVALIVSDFDSKSINPSYTTYARPNAINQTIYAASMMKPVVDYFTTTLKHPYQLSKLDMIALPDFISGAMENWGLITYRESNMLFHSEHSPIVTKQSIAAVIAHEIAHQWFGNVVSPQWWNYTWLSEGFARYFQYYATAQVEQTWGLENQFVIEQLQNSFQIDGAPTSHPMTHDVYSPAEINGIFDQISYGKGGSVLRMVEKVIGKELFYGALHDYLDARKYNVGTPEYLIEALQGQVDENASLKFNVKEFMDSWTTQAGYPVVNVHINRNTAWLSQKRFLLTNSCDVDVYKLWWIPITYATKSQPDFSNTTPKSWFTTNYNSIDLSDIQVQPDDWIVFNVQEAGYYRVNYDTKSWGRIIKGLMSEDFQKINNVNRAALIDDVLNLARAGHTDYFHALNATRYLTQETNYIPWKAALNGLSYLNKKFTGKDIYELYKIHIVTILTPIYNKLGFNEIANESHYDKLLRSNVLNWACEFGVKDCINNSLQSFAAWKLDSSKLVPVNLRTTIYCTAIKYGTLEDFKFLWNKYLEIDVPAEQSIIINALGCSMNTKLLITLLESAIDKINSPFRYQDIASVFSSVYTAGLFGAQTTLNFVIQHYNSMYEYFGNYDDIADIIGSISTHLSTKESVLQLQGFVEKNTNNFSTVSNSLNKYVTHAHEELTWYDNKSPRIFEWLDTTYPSSDYRLPKSIDPIKYTIFLVPHLDNNDFNFDGAVHIQMRVNQNVSSIVLHANALTINEIEVSTDIAKLDVSNYSINSTTEKLTIYLTTTVNVATILYVNIQYSGKLNNNMVGFYRSYYEDDNGTIHWLASTQFEKFGARQAFPCFDEPSFKAKFTVNIERPDHYHTLSNMPLRIHGLSDKVNHTWDYYEESELMSSYLVAFIISDFDSLVNEKGNFKVWSRPNAIKFAKEALDVGEKALSFLEKYTGINYPIAKMDMAAVPDFAAGAMENWGLVTFREYGMLTSQNITNAVYMRYMTTTIAHELVHMWFGDLVTCDWWEYLWLNEGFAEYLEYLVVDSINPDWNMNQHFISYELQNALLRDSFPYMRAMNNKMETPFDEGKDFTSVAYPKSASVIHMMHCAFGKDIFAKGLHTYLDTHKYKTGKPEYLWSALQIHVDAEGGMINTNETVATLMDSWASQPGYPVVTANLSVILLTLTQERFLVTGRNETSSNQLYWVPITIASKSNPNFDNASIILWFGNKKKIVYQPKLKDEWFILNVQQSGYYRVNYNVGNWIKLIDALNEKNFDGIPEINRAQIIDDILNLARAEYVSYDLALTATQYLSKELHHLPWRAFFSGYAYLNERFDGHGVGEILQKYVLKLSENVYKNLGFNEAANDTQLIKTNRQLILSWLCKLNHSDCVQTSKELFTQWRNNSKILIPADAKPAIICTALKYGDYEDWNFAWNQYRSSNFESDKVVILNALGCSQNPTAINQYLNEIFSRNGTIRDQNVAMAFSSIYSAGKFGVTASIEFLVNNYKTVYKYYGSWGSVANLFSNVASKFSTDAEIDKLKDFINKIPEDLKVIVNSLNTTVIEAWAGMEFFNKHGAVIKNTLSPIPTTTSPDTDEKGNTSSRISPSIFIFISTLIVLSVAFH